MARVWGPDCVATSETDSSCRICDGTGIGNGYIDICGPCGGQGWYYLEPESKIGDRVRIDPCNECLASPNCGDCGGTGMCQCDSC